MDIAAHQIGYFQHADLFLGGNFQDKIALENFNGFATQLSYYTGGQLPDAQIILPLYHIEKTRQDPAAHCGEQHKRLLPPL
jgi:hypothetical protein